MDYVDLRLIKKRITLSSELDHRGKMKKNMIVTF